ncbi:MAG: hypothetical protein R2705_00070 [Ilumatobacteraceae bacterium]
MSDFERINSGGTRLMVERPPSATASDGSSTSSNSPFGTNPKPDEFFRNDEPLSLYLGYGLSKMHAELHEGGAGPGRWRSDRPPPWFYGPFQPARARPPSSA